MEPIGIAFLAIAALLVGALLPLIFQARATLRSMQTALDTSAPKLDRILTEVTETTQEANHVIKEAAATLDQVRGTVRTVSAIGSAVGPAMVAAVQAFKAIRAQEAQDEYATPPNGKPGGQPVD